MAAGDATSNDRREKKRLKNIFRHLKKYMRIKSKKKDRDGTKRRLSVERNISN